MNHQINKLITKHFQINKLIISIFYSNFNIPTVLVTQSKAIVPPSGVLNNCLKFIVVRFMKQMNKSIEKKTTMRNLDDLLYLNFGGFPKKLRKTV
jgi:hypothetical protein